MRLFRALSVALSLRGNFHVWGTRKITSTLAALAMFLLSTGIFFTGDLLNSAPAEAASSAQINVGATSVRVGQANNLGISLSNFSTAEQANEYQITLKYVDASGVEQSNGTLSATKGSTSLIPGYASYSAAKLGFKGSYAAIRDALQTVSWTPGTASSGLTLRIGLATLPGTNKFYDANSGHFYEYVSSAKTWPQAKADAASRTLFGLTGYLAHITSRAENDFVANETSAPSIWVGATDAASEGQWRWSGATISGESDYVFNTYSPSETLNSATPSASAPNWGLNSWYASSNRYAGWATGEPNNWGGSEDCAVTNWSGGSGSWNDLDCNTSAAYLVEYGGGGGTLNTLSLTVNATMGASNALATWNSPASPSSTATQSFGLTFNYAISELVASDIINVGTATGCVFSPSAASALSGASITVTASGCSDGTLQPRLLENSVNVSGGLVIPAATATAINVVGGDADAGTSTVTLNSTITERNGSPVTLTLTPRDVNSRRLGSGKTVNVTATLATTSVTDNGDGTYTVTVTPGPNTGSSTISVTVGGITISTDKIFTIGSRPNISTTTSNANELFGQAISSINFANQIGIPSATYTLSSGSLPQGITLNSVTGEISGTPEASGVFNFRVTATNQFGSSQSLASSLTVNHGATFSGGDQSIDPEGSLSTSYNSSVSAGSVTYPAATYSIRDGQLPPGISLSSSGTLSGTPTESGVFTFKIRATNNFGFEDTVLKTITVGSVPTILNGTISSVGYLTEEYDGTPIYSGYPAPSLSVVSGSLPTGLRLNGTTNRIEGIPTQAGTFTFKIRATNFAGHADSSLISLVIHDEPVFADLNSLPVFASFNEAYSGQASFHGPVTTYELVSCVCDLSGSEINGLPTGLTLNTGTGQISGTARTLGKFKFRIKAVGSSASLTAISSVATLEVRQAPVWTDQTIVNAAEVNTVFEEQVVAASNPAPTYSVIGSLPAGLALNPDTGAITGTATETGTYKFSIRASNLIGQSTTNEFNLTVWSTPVITDGQINSLGVKGEAFSDAFTVNAFPAPNYQISSGALPEGLRLDPLTGRLSGSPSTVGVSKFKISATSAGLYSFVSSEFTLTVEQAPTKPQVKIETNIVLGSPLSGSTTSTAYPAPVFTVVNGSLPDGATLNRSTGQITGTPTQAGNFTFSIAASNSQGTTVSEPLTLKIGSPEANIDIKVDVGEPALGAPVSVASEGLQPDTGYTVTVRSDPQVVGSGRTSRLGEILAKVKIPENLEPGWHSITLETTGADGNPLKEVAWFEITATGLLEDVQTEEPTSSEKKSALTDDNTFYEEIGIDPGTQVEPEAVASTVQEVSSVVASVALVSAAAAATAAVASAASAAAAAAGASAAAGSAASAGASGSMSSGGGSSPTRAPSSGGSGGTGTSSSGGSSSGSARGGVTGNGSASTTAAGPDGDSRDGGDGGDYGNLEADHDDFSVEHSGWGDRLAWWASPFMTFMDKISVEATELTSKISPVFSRIINDGAYLRAMFGGVMAVPYLVALTLGALSVDVHAKSLAGAGNVALLSIILVLGTLDAFAGLLGILAFAVVSISIFGIHSLGDVRYLLAMTIAAFAPIILSTTFRKIRRPAIGNLSDVWERVIDVFMIAFVASLATLSVVGGISAFAGATVPLADNAKNLVFVITAVALIRILLEEFAAKAFSGRLDRINPTEVSGAGTLQQWISLVFKYSVLVVMIGDMVGWGWWLWTGALIMFVPGIIGMTFQDLPKSKLLTQIIPGGLAALLLATLLSSWSGDLVGAVLKGSEMYGPLSFLLVPLPVIIVAIVGMFADGGDKWYVERNLKWVYVLGGIGVFISTVWATDFVGQIFG